MVDWIQVGPVEAIALGRVRTFKHGVHQLVVGRTVAGDAFALDNRCPHEGYPLAQGDLKECVLTCAWHNWKFDVRDGRCVLGGEGAQSFPVRVTQGRLEVDLAEPDPAVLVPRWLESLSRGLFEHDNGRALRDATRLLRSGYDARRLLADVARYDALHAENGTTHVLPLAADCVRLLPRYAGTEALRVLAPVIDLCGETNRRLPPRSRSTTPDIATDGETLGSALREEEPERAEALLRGAARAGVPRLELEAWLYSILSKSFTDFGHQLIYLVKARELLEAVASGPDGSVDARERTADLYGALVRSITLATREDTLPYLRPYFQRLAAVEDDLPRVYAKARHSTPFDPSPVLEAVLDGTLAQSFDSVWRALTLGVPAVRVAEALVVAAAQRLFRFDPQIDRDPDVQEGWLWATHRLTFASAVRHAVTRFDRPETLRFLVQAAAFIHSGHPMDAPLERRAPLPQASDETAPSPLEIAEAVRSRQPEAAVAGALGYVRGGGPVARLRETFEELCLEGRFVRPIFDAHAIKTTWVAFEEFESLGSSPNSAVHSERLWPLAAGIRFLASPVNERGLRNDISASLRWVVEGKIPGKLTQ